MRKMCLLLGKEKKKKLILYYNKPIPRGPIHQMFDVKNEIGFVAKQQISVKQKFYFWRIVFYVS